MVENISRNVDGLMFHRQKIKANSDERFYFNDIMSTKHTDNMVIIQARKAVEDSEMSV